MKLTACRFCGLDFYYEPIAGLPFEIKATVCNTCDEKHRSAAQQALHESRLTAWRALCPPIYQDTDINHPSMPIASKTTKVLNWQYGPLGITLHGRTRKGKTRLMWLLIKRLMVEDGKRVEACTAGQFADNCALVASLGSEEAIQWKREMSVIDVLFIDDFGKFKLTERVEADLFEIMEQRTQNRKPLLLTTNFDGKELLSKMSPDRGAPFVARLREFTTAVNL